MSKKRNDKWLFLFILLLPCVLILCYSLTFFRNVQESYTSTFISEDEILFNRMDIITYQLADSIHDILPFDTIITVPIYDFVTDYVYDGSTSAVVYIAVSLFSYYLLISILEVLYYALLFLVDLSKKLLRGFYD